MIDLKFTRLTWCLPVLILVLAWYAAIRIIWTDWTIDPQYSYGVLVPLLVIGLLLKRWEHRPKPSTLSTNQKRLVTLFLFGAALIIMAVIPIAEANPDWRPLGGAASLAAVTISLCLVSLAGGWTWLRHFAFPLCFFIIAVPWPRNLEQGVMSPLMAWNTGITLEILHWAGYEAMNQGNLILLPSGVLGIEEACSGIRSLQSGLMAALFFGEIFRLPPQRRLGLLFIAIGAALIGNICRSSMIALVASSQGVQSISLWHDRAGMLVMLIAFGLILGCAWRWRRYSTSLPKKKSLEPIHPLGKRAILVLISVLLLLLSSFVSTELWYRDHEKGGVNRWSWRLHERHGVRGVVEMPISQSTLRMLFYPDGFSERWVTDRGVQGQVFYFQWAPGRTAAHAVSMHNPEVCLSNIGIILTSALPPIVVRTGNDHLSFNSWLFNDRGNPVYVFHTLQEQGAETGRFGSQSDSLLGRLRAVASGHRNHGQRMVEVAFWNLPSEKAAKEALLHYLANAVEPPSSASPKNSAQP